MNIGQQPRVYPAVYSGVGVYECMIRGIAVMRRRADSYVNATQILKVAGIDKGRRTKILEKEILPGKHEIVQGGYGKYQGTWIPLERGRDVAAQYGVAPLLAPLFDHVPNNTMMGALPHQLPMRIPGNMPPMPFPNMRPPHYMIRYMPNMLHGVPPMFGPGGPMYPPYQQMPPGPPGSQPRMQMYAPQPLPPGAHQMHQQAMMNHFISSNANTSAPSSSSPAQSSSNTHAESHPSLKRIREEEESEPMLSQDTDITMVNGPDDDVFSHPGPEGPPPPKKARTDGGPTNGLSMGMDINGTARSSSPITTIDPKRLLTAFPPTTILPTSLEPSDDEMMPRQSTISTANRLETRDAVRRSTRRAALFAAIQEDEAEVVVRLLLEQTDEPMLAASDINAIIDYKGHTALHVAAALGKLAIVEALVSRGADVHRGNYRGETALMRAVLARETYEAQTFEALLKLLRQSIRTTDEFKKSVLHHISHVAALDRVAEANYYLLTILLWIGKHQGGNSDTLINLKDVNGDTALNIASRLGMNSLVEALITAGADPSSSNKFGITPLDYGVIDVPQEAVQADNFDELAMNVSQLFPRTSEAVLQDMMNLINSMAHDINSEKTSKDAEYAELRAKIREMSRQLAANRKELDRLRPQSMENDLVELRITNLDEQKTAPDTIEWTGRSQQAMDKDVSPAFWRRKQALVQPAQDPSLVKAIELALDPSSPEANSQESLILLRRMKMWHERIQAQMKQHKASVELNSEKELQLRKFLALCTGLSELEVEEQASSLLVSAQTETQEPGPQRLAAFMDKVKLRMALIVS